MPVGYNHFKVRLLELQGFSPATYKIVKDTLLTSVMEHMIVCDHEVVHKDLSFLLTSLINIYWNFIKRSLLVKGISHNFSQSILPGVITI